MISLILHELGYLTAEGVGFVCSIRCYHRLRLLLL